MIEKGQKVKFHYVLKAEGEIVDQSPESQPLEYEQGAGQILPALEQVIGEMTVGDKKEVTLSPEDGYGLPRKEAIIQVDRKSVQVENLEVGAKLQATDPQGKTHAGTVVELNDDNLTVDFNHPLAGKTLDFQVELLEVA